MARSPLSRIATAFSRPHVCVSFPKSGRTWLRVMLDELGLKVRFDHAGSEHVDPKPIEQVPVALPEASARLLFLYRDPIDTAVSGFHQASQRIRNFDGSMSDFLRDPRHGVEKIAHFNRQWLAALRDRPNTAILSYEDLSRQTAHELGRVAYFFGTYPSLARLADVAAANRFDAMQKREKSGALGQSYGKMLKPGDAANPDSLKVRKGQVGGYRDELSDEDIAWAQNAVRAIDAAG